MAKQAPDTDKGRDTVRDQTGYLKRTKVYWLFKRTKTFAFTDIVFE